MTMDRDTKKTLRNIVAKLPEPTAQLVMKMLDQRDDFHARLTLILWLMDGKHGMGGPPPDIDRIGFHAPRRRLSPARAIAWARRAADGRNRQWRKERSTS